MITFIILRYHPMDVLNWQALAELLWNKNSRLTRKQDGKQTLIDTCNEHIGLAFR